tara:strand:- start:553 stop:678 length:126 start_codon:yes stop_codon:yes gene_type:complete
MNRIKNYFRKQASRPAGDLVFDFIVVGSFLTCVYVGFIAAQ